MVTSSSLSGINSIAFKNGDPAPKAVQPGQFRIYGMRFCPYSERALIYLARKGIRAEVVNINLSDKPDWYFKKNAAGKIPTLEHDGKLVAGSDIIPQYLDEIFPETSVLPSDPYERAQQRILFDQLSPFGGALHGVYIATAETRQATAEKLKAELIKAESKLEHKFYGGDRAGFVDYMMYPFFERLALFAGQPGAEAAQKENFPGKEQYPRLSGWFKSMQGLPEITAVQQPSELMTKYMLGHIKGDNDYDLGI